MRCVTELRWNTSARSTTTPTELCFRGRRTYRSSKFAASATVPNYNGTVIVISVLSGLRQRNNTYLGYRTGRWSNPGAEWCDTVTQVHTVDVGSLLFSLIFIHSFIHSSRQQTAPLRTAHDRFSTEFWRSHFASGQLPTHIRRITGNSFAIIDT